MILLRPTVVGWTRMLDDGYVFTFNFGLYFSEVKKMDGRYFIITGIHKTVIDPDLLRRVTNEFLIKVERRIM